MNVADPMLTVLPGFGDICPRGYYCPAGSIRPQGCSPGTYQDQEGESTCQICPPGSVNRKKRCAVVDATIEDRILK